jgi:hypothetical protein
VGAGPSLAVLFDQVSQSLVDKRLNLASFVASERTKGRQDIGIDLRSEFFPEHNDFEFGLGIMTHHETSRKATLLSEKTASL